MKDFQNTKIAAISLMFAVGCNLSCDYCLIHKSRYNNKFIEEMRKNTIQALDDGTYLNNILKVIDKMDGDPRDIRQIDLWGQEPTLQLEYFTKHIQDWLAAFPRLDRIFFSTNGVAFWEKIYDLIIEVDNNIDHDILIRLQWSYDGDYSTNNIRHGSSQIMKNLESLIKKLNTHKFNHVQVDVAVHGVLSFALMREINGEMDKLRAYYRNCVDTIRPISDLVSNENMHVHHTIALGEETPYKCSTEEGCAWYDFISKLMIIQETEEQFSTTHINEIYFNAIKRAFPPHVAEKYSNLDELVYDLCTRLNPNTANTTMADNGHAIEISQLISDSFFCGTGQGEIKVLYDGTLINCQNSIYEKDIENINPEVNMLNEIKRSQSRAGVVFMNPLTDSEEKIQKYKYLFTTGRSSSFWHSFLTVYQKMRLMSFAGQISAVYYRDPFLTLKHAFILCMINQCTYNNGIMTGSYWCRDTGLIRRYANGMLLLEEANGKVARYLKDCQFEKTIREREKEREYKC